MKSEILKGVRSQFPQRNKLEDLRDANIALGPHLEEKTCDRFWLKTIIRVWP